MIPCKLPAYAKPLADLRRRGRTPSNRTLTVRLHWGSYAAIGYGVIVPDRENPGALSWEFARDLEVMVLARNDDAWRVDRACNAIAAVHPARLVLVDLIAERIVSILEPREVAHAA